MTTSPNRMLGIIFGVIYFVIGIFGFFITSSTGFTATAGPVFIGLFEVNPLHNLIHLAIGVVLLIAGLAGTRSAKGFNTLIGAVFLVVGIVGLFIAGSNPANILALNGADNVLHFATAVVLLAVGIGAERPAPKKA